MNHFSPKQSFRQTFHHISVAVISLLILAVTLLLNTADFYYHLNRYTLDSSQQILQNSIESNEDISQNSLLASKTPEHALMFSLFLKLLISSTVIILILAVYHRRHEVKMQTVENSLRTINQSLKLALEHASINLYIYDFASGSMTSHSLSDEQGRPRVFKNGPHTMVEIGAVAPEHVDEFLALFQQIRNTSCVLEKNLLMRRPSSCTYAWSRITLTAVSETGKSSTQAIVTFEDISEELRRENELRLRSYQDALTGLLNRSGLRHEMAELVQKAPVSGSVAFLLIDLDHFKAVNDTLGHPTGDLLLQKAASLLLNFTSKNSHCVRFGGDEFVILLPNSSWEEAEMLAQRICSEMPLLSDQLSLSVPVGASIGLHLFDPKVESLQQVYQKSDVALYSAKKKRGCWVSTRSS